MRPFFEYLKTICSSPVGAEIGVDYGHNASDILNGLSPVMLYLVDNYPIYTRDTTIASQREKKRVASDKFSSSKNVTFIHKDSIFASEDIKDESLDFVYIDANHRYENARADIEAWFPKLKPGGMIGGHDFDGSEDTYGVYRAVCDWAIQNKMRVTFENSDWWSIK